MKKTTLLAASIMSVSVSAQANDMSCGLDAQYDPALLAQQPIYQTTLELATNAYIYGEPLLNMERIFSTNTSVSEQVGQNGAGPVNQFNHVRGLLSADQREVVSPNNDTLYSIAWLDLSDQPMVISVPEVEDDRFLVIPFLSPYQENFANIGSSSGVYPEAAVPAGDYIITPPSWNENRPIPKGLTQIKSPYDRSWIIGRIEIRDEADEVRVNEIQDQLSITPLTKWRRQQKSAVDLSFLDEFQSGNSGQDLEINIATIPGTQEGEDPMDFFDALGVSLAQFEPPVEDQPLLDQLEPIGIGIGLSPCDVFDTGSLDDAAALQGIRDALAAGSQKLDLIALQKFQQAFVTTNGWLVNKTGLYGTNYIDRAFISRVGLGALRSELSTYPVARTDRFGVGLAGVPQVNPQDPTKNRSGRYVAYMPQVPPVESFWSLTLYDNEQFFTDNVLDRYVLNDRSPLAYNPDGSVLFYIQNEMPNNPGQVANWLPAPQSGFNMIMRLYDPTPESFDGLFDGTSWQAPTIFPCAPNENGIWMAVGSPAPIPCGN